MIYMIESPTGINNLEAMIEAAKNYGGVDACFVGPNDMLGNMGETPSMWSTSKQFLEGMEHIRETCKKHGVASGIHCGDAEAVSDRIAEGWQWLALASEARFMMHDAAVEIASVKGWQPVRRRKSSNTSDEAKAAGFIVLPDIRSSMSEECDE